MAETIELRINIARKLGDRDPTRAVRHESNQIRGVLGCQLGLLGDTKPGVPPLERAGEIAVEHIGTDLQQQMRAARRPPHLLLFHHALRDELIDRGFNETGRNPLFASIPLTIVGNPGTIVDDVPIEFSECSGNFKAA
jgi:hypothetical protein